jgi:hypothetical protein
MSKLSIQSALITAVAIAGFAVGRSWPADDRAYYVKAIESSLAECLENLKAKRASIECSSGLAPSKTRAVRPEQRQSPPRR